MRTDFISKPAIRFPDGEMFIGVATYVIESDKITWSCPNKIRDTIEKSKIAYFTEPPNTEYINELNRIYENALSLPAGTINSVLYREYGPKLDRQLWDACVFLNSECSIARLEGRLKELFTDMKQIATAYVIDNQIVSVATDNSNGTVTVLTDPSHRKKGYASACLSRLVHEYRVIGKKLGFATEDDNEAAIRTAEKCGMYKWGYGYWIKVPPEKVEEFSSLLSDL